MCVRGREERENREEKRRKEMNNNRESFYRSSSKHNSKYLELTISKTQSEKRAKEDGEKKDTEEEEEEEKHKSVSLSLLFSLLFFFDRSCFTLSVTAKGKIDIAIETVYKEKRMALLKAFEETPLPQRMRFLEILPSLCAISGMLIHTLKQNTNVKKTN